MLEFFHHLEFFLDPLLYRGLRLNRLLSMSHSLGFVFPALGLRAVLGQYCSILAWLSQFMTSGLVIGQMPNPLESPEGTPHIFGGKSSPLNNSGISRKGLQEFRIILGQGAG